MGKKGLKSNFYIKFPTLMSELACLSWTSRYEEDFQWNAMSKLLNCVHSMPPTCSICSRTMSDHSTSTVFEVLRRSRVEDLFSLNNPPPL